MSIRNAVLEDLKMVNTRLTKIYNYLLQDATEKTLNDIGGLVYSSGELVLDSIRGLEMLQLMSNTKTNSSKEIH